MFTAVEEGEYRVCFNNEMSTFAEKMVDFEIAVKSTSDTLTSSSYFLQKPLLLQFFQIYYHKLILGLQRLKTKFALNYPPKKDPLLNRPPSSKSPSSSFPASYRRSIAIKSTSAHARTAISVPCDRQRNGFSTLVL